MKRRFNFNRCSLILSNAIDGATTKNNHWGFKPCACKGGATTNFEIPNEIFKRELYEYMNGGIINA